MVKSSVYPGGVLVPGKIIVSIFGLLLLISIFLPWMSPTSKLSLIYSSVYGKDINTYLTVAGILGGGLTLALAWGPFRRARGILHILVGIAVLAVLAIMLFNHTLPLLSSTVRSLVTIGMGVYLYAFSVIVVIIVGITELPKRRSRVHGRVAQAPQVNTTQTYGAPMQVYTDAAPNASKFCTNCGSRVNHPGASFCSSCGMPVAMAAPVAPAYGQPAYQPSPMKPVQKVSGAWWLLPIFLGALGGIIAFFAVLKRRPVMAVAMLILGIILTAIAFFVIRTILTNTLSNYGISIS